MMVNPFFLGLRALWRAWTDPDFCRLVVPMLESGPATAPAADAAPAPSPDLPSAVAVTGRSDALSLLAVLQREGRFLDFLKEPVDTYSDAQVGAAVRGLHKECGTAVERMFGVQPFLPQEEGATVEIPVDHDPAQYHLVGTRARTATGGHPGTLMHPGWQATRIELPVWAGREESARVLAPAEVEVR